MPVVSAATSKRVVVTLLAVGLSLGGARAAPPGEARDLQVIGFDPATGELTLQWQPGCDALDHHIEMGPLDQVSSYAYSGQVCGLGTSGTFAGFQPGGGSVFFLVVADDGASIEGSYGLAWMNGQWTERPAATADPQCMFQRDLSQTCALPAAPALDLTGHRPQSEAYGLPFQRRAMPATEEIVPGLGVRLNGDDDDASGIADVDETGVSFENDLVELTLTAAPSPVYGVGFVLQRSGANVRVWDDALKTEGLLVNEDATPVDLSAGSRTVWVESAGGGSADLTLSAVAVSGGASLASASMHVFTFESVVIALGGESQVPADPLLEPDNHGTFALALDLHELGYDVHMYDEDVVSASGAGAAYDEVVRAVNGRGVTAVVIYGYSHGGGSTNDLARRLDTNRASLGPFTIEVTAYIDGIDNDSDIDVGTESELPPSTLYHLNYYENPGCGFFALCGGPVEGADLNLDVNTTPWGGGLDHFTVDDAPEVLQGILDAILARVPR